MESRFYMYEVTAEERKGERKRVEEEGRRKKKTFHLTNEVINKR